MQNQNNTAFAVNATGLPIVGLPLFVWAEFKAKQSPSTPLAARRLMRLHGLPERIARLYAEHAGFCMEVQQ